MNNITCVHIYIYIIWYSIKRFLRVSIFSPVRGSQTRRLGGLPNVSNSCETCTMCIYIYIYIQYYTVSPLASDCRPVRAQNLPANRRLGCCPCWWNWHACLKGWHNFHKYLTYSFGKYMKCRLLYHCISLPCFGVWTTLFQVLHFQAILLPSCTGAANGFGRVSGPSRGLGGFIMACSWCLNLRTWLERTPGSQ